MCIALSLPANWQTMVTPTQTSWIVSPISTSDVARQVDLSIGFYGGVAVNFFLLRDGRIVVPTAPIISTSILTPDKQVGATKARCVPPQHAIAYAPMITTTLVQLLHLIFSVSDENVECTPYAGDNCILAL